MSDALDELETVLLQLTVVLPSDKDVWDANQLLRFAVERLWILAGNSAESHRVAAGIDPDVDPWTELYDFRCVLAHATPGRLDHDRVWREGVHDLGRLLGEVRAARA